MRNHIKQNHLRVLPTVTCKGIGERVQENRRSYGSLGFQSSTNRSLSLILLGNAAI